eukprot:1158193-Pelagomonas_calceolata.AAC.8
MAVSMSSQSRGTQQSGTSFFIPEDINHSKTITCTIHPYFHGPTNTINRAEKKLCRLDIGSADRLALQGLQIPEHSKNTFPRSVHCLCSFLSSLIFPVSVEKKKGHGWSKEHSAPATATPTTSKVHHPSQLLPEQRHVLWRSNAMKTPGLRISLRPPSSSTVIYVAIFQGPDLKLPFTLIC